MIAFQEKFKGEVNEYFERLEAGLLQLEQDPGNFQVVDEVFRIMHSMKGSGGMFGFDLLSDVTHDLESLFEIFRSQKMLITSEVISFTLNSIDGLNNLLTVEPTNELRQLAKTMKEETVQLINRITPQTELSSAVKLPEIKSSADQTTYFISFIPHENILENGTNPLYLIDELNALGECNIQVSFDSLPDLMAIDPGKCYTSWEMFISTPENIDTLNDVFIFVSDKAKLEIVKVADGNRIGHESILADFLNSRISNEIWILPEPKKKDTNRITEAIPPENKENVPLNRAVGTDEQLKTGAVSWSSVESVRVDSRKIDQYMNLVSELITAQSRLETVSSKINDTELEMVTEAIEKISRQLRDNAFDMSLIPLQSISVRFKRLIHDLSKSLDKEVELATEGLETVLDKNIIEKLVEPILHIIRNSMDHGIESKEERTVKSKNQVGTISIKASTVGSYVQIEISDDGKGLDIRNIHRKAIEKGFISEQDKFQENDLLKLIFEPGFSTSELVTDVSGRGVGLDVVRRKIQEMRGTVDVESETGFFTRFILKLPLSLSIIDGLLTRVGESFYVIPSSAIRKIYMVNPQMLKKEFRQVVELEGNLVPYLNIYEEFEKSTNLPAKQFAVTVSFANHVFALVVDEVLREYQAVIKPLGKLLNGQDIFSGASILGNGQLALVLDTNKIIQKYS